MLPYLWTHFPSLWNWNRTASRQDVIKWNDILKCLAQCLAHRSSSVCVSYYYIRQGPRLMSETRTYPRPLILLDKVKITSLCLVNSVDYSPLSLQVGCLLGHCRALPPTHYPHQETMSLFVSGPVTVGLPTLKLCSGVLYGGPPSFPRVTYLSPYCHTP